jgi:hypothetical protein
MIRWDYVSELRPPTGLLLIAGWYVSMETMVMMIMPAENNSWLVRQSSLAVLPAETSGASRRIGQRSENFAYPYLKYLKGSLTRRKILWHGASGFTSHPKEAVLRIFIAVKNPSSRPTLNPRPLGPVASTLTTTPPRRPHLFWLPVLDYIRNKHKLTCVDTKEDESSRVLMWGSVIFRKPKTSTLV